MLALPTSTRDGVGEGGGDGQGQEEGANECRVELHCLREGGRATMKRDVKFMKLARGVLESTYDSDTGFERAWGL